MFVSWSPVLLDLVGAVVVIGVLIFVHELGHFLAAKSVGIAVLRFSFGLGPRTPIGIRIGETDYCLSWVPFGGFVKMAGVEDEGAAGAVEGGKVEADVPAERTFDAKPLWARMFVISAGVAMNALFALLVYSVIARAYGTPADTTVTVGAVDSTSLPLGASALATLRPGDRIVRINGDSMTGWGAIQQKLYTASGSRITIEVAGRPGPILLDVPRSEKDARASLIGALSPWHEPLVGEVLPGRAAAAAGLEPGDRVDSAGGVATPSWETMQRIIERSAGRPLPLAVERGGRVLHVVVTPRAEAARDPATGKTVTVGRIGVGPVLRRFGLLGSLGEGLRQTGSAAGIILFTLKGLVTGQVSVRDIGGPILVGQLAGEVARTGLRNFLAFMALFSINLAILNLLPIPVLDGGHLAFLAIEGVRGRPLSLAQRQRLTQIGFVVLVGIMVLALSNDVLRLFR